MARIAVRPGAYGPRPSIPFLLLGNDMVTSTSIRGLKPRRSFMMDQLFVDVASVSRLLPPFLRAGFYLIAKTSELTTIYGALGLLASDPEVCIVK